MARSISYDEKKRTFTFTFFRSSRDSASQEFTDQLIQAVEKEFAESSPEEKREYARWILLLHNFPASLLIFWSTAQEHLEKDLPSLDQQTETSFAFLLAHALKELNFDSGEHIPRNYVIAMMLELIRRYSLKLSF